ncbi:MAG: hypothetical protein NVSMB56_19300 [Pyrinomonadaceae bacterium]
MQNFHKQGIAGEEKFELMKYETSIYKGYVAHLIEREIDQNSLSHEDENRLKLYIEITMGEIKWLS